MRMRWRRTSRRMVSAASTPTIWRCGACWRKGSKASEIQEVQKEGRHLIGGVGPGILSQAGLTVGRVVFQKQVVNIPLTKDGWDMVRVVSYTDGFNLYFGLKSKGWKRYYWLDLSALSESLLIPGQELQSTHYFTSRLTPTSVNWADKQRQDTYLDALQARNNVFIHYGHYLKKTRECRQCKANWPDYEEKMTDVNIAVQLLADAYDDKFDTAIIISADSDLVTPA